MKRWYWGETDATGLSDEEVSSGTTWTKKVVTWGTKLVLSDLGGALGEILGENGASALHHLTGSLHNSSLNDANLLDFLGVVGTAAESAADQAEKARRLLKQFANGIWTSKEPSSEYDFELDSCKRKATTSDLQSAKLNHTLRVYKKNSKDLVASFAVVLPEN